MRRKILQRTKSLLRFLGLGHMRNAGAELPYRKRVEFMLDMIFGPTFDKNSYWYGKPNPDEFFTSIMILAGAKDDIGATDGGQIFKLKPNTQSYEVSRAQLSRIGVDEDKLRELFAQTPAADEAHRKTPTRPLFVPNPRHLNQVKGTYDRDHAEALGAADALTGLFQGHNNNNNNNNNKAKSRSTVKKPTATKRKAAASSSKESESEKVNLHDIAEELIPELSSGKPDNKKGKMATWDDMHDNEPDDAQPAQALVQCEEYDAHMKGQFAQFGMGLKIRPIDGSHSEFYLADLDFISEDELDRKLHEGYEISSHDACNSSQAELERATIEHELLRVYLERDRERTMGLTHSIDVLKAQLAAELEEPFRAQATELMRTLKRIVDQAIA